jgi:hypothetical protein
VTNLRGACLMRDLVEDMFLMHLISWMLERSGRDPVTIRAFAEKEKPDLAVGKRETNRELTLPETV